MGIVRGSFKLALVVTLGFLFTSCATPINENGIANRTVVNELLKAANDAGFENTTKASHDCPVPFDCPATQSHSASLQMPAKGRTFEDGCKILLKFATEIGSKNISDDLGLATSLASDKALSTCTDALSQGLDETYLDNLGLIESSAIFLDGSVTTETKISVSYHIQFNSYLSKNRERGFMLYISANTGEYSG